MKILYLLMLLNCSAVFSETLFPPDTVYFKICDASAHLEKAFESKDDDPFSVPYIDRAWLLKVEGKHLWFFSVAFPKEGYKFYTVYKSGDVRLLKGDDLKSYLLLAGLISEE